ncbi:MAG: multiheme c-type cytochrome [Burkholderiales bacterium]
MPATATPASRRTLFVAVALLAIVVVAAGYAAYRALAPAPAATAPAAPFAPARFVGAAACAACHAKETEAWRGSDHDLAMQPADGRTVLGDFGNAKLEGTTFFLRDGKYFVNTEGPDGKRADFEIKYTFGVRPLQQYLIELPGGRMQAFGLAWDSRPKEQGGQRWLNLYPGRNLKPGDALHWTGIEQNWNFQCAECHSTNLRKGFDAASGTFHTTWSDVNVACEACHGPGSNHVAWAKKEGDAARDPAKGLAVALDERRGITWSVAAGMNSARRSAPRTTSREIDLCGRCHARAARFSDDYKDGGAYGDTHRRTPLSDGLYWPDGQMRDEVYNWGSFLQSRMHAQGVTCSDCHDPHSLKLRAPGNAVCGQCHAAAAFDSEAHTHHAKGTTGAACVSCHMPTTTYMVVDPRHDHSFRIPRPDLTVTLGVPNACNNCHTKKTPQWAAEAADTLWGKERKGYQKFAEAFVAGTSGAPGGRGKLLAIADDPAQPAIVRASAIERLAPWLTPTTTASIARALNDADPLVRTSAVNALAGTDAATRQRYLPRMLADPVRIVRMEAAQALAGDAEPGLPPDARAAFARALDEYIAAQAYNADRPEARVNMGNLYARRSDGERAIAEYRKAIEIDPTYVPAYANLADFYRSRGADGEASKALREGLARQPQSAVLHHALGLALVREKRMSEAIPELALAVKLAPDDARFAYVYAVALDGAKQGPKAREVLVAASRRHPYDRAILEALASYSARDGKPDAALAYAKTLRDLEPENPQYASMVQELERGRR